MSLTPLGEVFEGSRSWVLLEGDAGPILRELWDGCVDHVITDPPYSSRTHRGARSARRLAASETGRTDAKEATLHVISFDPFDRYAQARTWTRLAKRWTLAFCELEQLGLYRAANPETWVRGGFWRRTNGAPQFSGDRPGQPGEGVAILHRKGRKRWNHGGHHAYWEFPRHQHTALDPRIHPTQKPLPLLEAMLAEFTDPGEIVLDPYAGSAAVGAACIRMGRRYIGIELDAATFTAARARLEATAAPAAQLSMLSAAGEVAS